MELNENKLSDIKVSVIMPIFNASDYLRPAVESVLDQTLKEIELICIDDGSSDGSREMLRAYAKKDERIRLFTEVNSGPAVARNNGLRRARGEFIAFLDADDFYEADFLEKIYRFAVEKRLDIAIARFDLYHTKKAVFRPNIGSDHGEIFADGKVTSKNEHPDMILQAATGYVWNKLFRRDFITEKNLTFPGEVRVFEDVYFVATALSLAERVGKIKNILIHHRVYPEQARPSLFRKYFAQIPDLYVSIKDFLMHNGMYAPLFKSFLNLSASRCYKVYNILPLECKKDFWTILHNGYPEKLGWANAPLESFESEDVARFCAEVELYTYRRHLRRMAGRLLSPKRIANILANFRRSKKMKQQMQDFFDSLRPVKQENDKDPMI